MQNGSVGFGWSWSPQNIIFQRYTYISFYLCLWVIRKKIMFFWKSNPSYCFSETFTTWHLPTCSGCRLVNRQLILHHHGQSSLLWNLHAPHGDLDVDPYIYHIVFCIQCIMGIIIVHSIAFTDLKNVPDEKWFYIIISTGYRVVQNLSMQVVTLLSLVGRIIRTVATPHDDLP